MQCDSTTHLFNSFVGPRFTRAVRQLCAQQWTDEACHELVMDYVKHADDHTVGTPRLFNNAALFRLTTRWLHDPTIEERVSWADFDRLTHNLQMSLDHLVPWVAAFVRVILQLHHRAPDPLWDPHSFLYLYFVRGVVPPDVMSHFSEAVAQLQQRVLQGGTQQLKLLLTVLSWLRNYLQLVSLVSQSLRAFVDSAARVLHDDGPQVGQDIQEDGLQEDDQKAIQDDDKVPQNDQMKECDAPQTQQASDAAQ